MELQERCTVGKGVRRFARPSLIVGRQEESPRSLRCRPGMSEHPHRRLAEHQESDRPIRCGRRRDRSRTPPPERGGFGFVERRADWGPGSYPRPDALCPPVGPVKHRDIERDEYGVHWVSPNA